MVNFHDPAVVALDLLALTKFFHALVGLYIWEFFITLDHEWSVVQGHRPYLWTIWIYSITRLATLVAVLLDVIVVNITTPTNCQIWITFVYVFSYIAVAFSSLLIALRAIAIWNKSKVVVALATSVWLTNLSFLILGITKIHSTWVPALSSCGSPDVESNKATMMFCL
ncbi:hypothetical protein BJV74DRAFT_275802 [Russula compacta]|nr:hypothetical protein BJV74DRAFT_275802 [Russula compacta]